MKLIYTLMLGSLLVGCKESSQPVDEKAAQSPPAPEQVKEPAVEEPVVEEPVVKEVEATGDARYIGMTKEAATALATKEGRPSRVVSEDGKTGMITMDHRPDRLNFTVVDGKITGVTRG